MSDLVISTNLLLSANFEGAVEIDAITRSFWLLKSSDRRQRLRSDR